MPPGPSTDDLDAALGAGNVDAAVAIAEGLLAAGVGDDPFVASLAAWGQVRAGELGAAEKTLARALADSPGDPGLLTTQAFLRRRQGRNTAAIAAADAALAQAPDHAPAWLERAFALDAGGALGAAGASYARAIACSPNTAAGHAGLAAIAARRRDFAAARASAATALAHDPADPVAHIALARCDRETAPALATTRLQTLLARPDLDPDNRIAALALLGDTAPDPDTALAAYIAANMAFAAQHASATDSQTALIRRIDQATRTLPAAPPPATRSPHAFLIGYPRSGTTLVETILASLPGVGVLEESPTLQDADHLLLAPDIAAALSGLDAATVARLQAAYRARVAAAGIPPDTACFIDMDPLKGIKLPIIARLFPTAAIIVMRRDPRDIVWSCFRTSFAPSSAALEFTSLERAAAHYDALMTFQEHWLARGDHRVHVVRYERLVADFDSETRRLCAFLGLAWSPAVRDFAATARTRDIATASAAQVRRGLFDGSGQWRRFAAALESVRPVLAPWVSRFGYDDWPA